MSPFLTGLISAAIIFGGALLGMRLQRVLPDQHLSKEMQDLVKLSAGMIATLTALVLGLLVSSAKSSFDAVNSGIVQGSANIVFLDRTLARYGPETKSVRDNLKRTLAAGMEKVWPAEKTGISGLSAMERTNRFDAIQDELGKLEPQSDSQRVILAQAQQLANTMGQSRWLLIEETHTPLPLALLVILVFWLVLLFISFGLFAPQNPTAHVVLFIGACAVSAAIFLVLELSQPFDGLIKVSSLPMRNALQHLSP